MVLKIVMILHIDMDAFYASVEQLDNPQLKGKGVIVGGLSSRSVVSAASYEARKFGIHSAMPMFQARKKCPQGVFIRPRMKRYKDISKKIMSLLSEYSPLVEPVSIDEAYVDVIGCERLHGDPVKIAASIKQKIKENFKLTCSVGVGPNKFIAKIASDLEKPDGLSVIMPDQVPPFLDSLPVHKVPGVGKTRRIQLDRMGIKTLGDVKKYSQEIIISRLGKFGRRILALADGIDDSPVITDDSYKSVSTEETFGEDIADKDLLNNYILQQSESVAGQLRQTGVRAKTITLKIKHADFKQVTRSVTLPTPTQSSKTIHLAASKLLEAYRIRTKVRLIGVGASGLVSGTVPVQMGIFEKENIAKHHWEKVDRAMDSITKKYGKKVVKRGTLKDD